MKNLCILDYAGNVRPGKPTVEAIESILDGHDNDQLATIRIDDGEIVATLLSDAEREALRGDTAKRRVDALIAALDAMLAVHRKTDGIPGVDRPYGSIAVEYERAPWAEPVVLDWAHKHGLHVNNVPPPPKPGKWTRQVDVTLGPKSWSPTLVTIRYPAILWTGEEEVARDAEAAGRAEDAQAIRATQETVATAPSADEMPF